MIYIDPSHIDYIEDQSLRVVEVVDIGQEHHCRN